MRTFCLLAGMLLYIFAGDETLFAETALEPFVYGENFETRELRAWASYPLWQDTAFDAFMRVNTMVPRDPNISIEQKIYPLWNEDTYAGAQKKLDMYLVPGSSITLRYYLKSSQHAEFVKIRLAAGPSGKLDVTIRNPVINRWEWVTVTFQDFIRENPRVEGVNMIRVNTLAVLAKVPDADPKMTIYFGLDDVLVKGMRNVEFQFSEPKVIRLPEWKPCIPERHYRRGDTLVLRGMWPLDADRVRLTITPFTERSKILLSADLKKQNGMWSLPKVALNYPEDLYFATLQAIRNGEPVSETQFTFYIAPKSQGHPRVWFDGERKKWVEARLKSEKFKDVATNIHSKAADFRARLPLEKAVFDFDQLPDEDIMQGDIYRIWFDRLIMFQDAVYYNALQYAFFGDQEAGDYSRQLLVKVCEFPFWLNPWFTKRGENTYYPISDMGRYYSVSYDVLYDILSENERATIRKALIKNVIQGAHRGYVVNNMVTTNTSNWIPMIIGGSIVCQAAMYGDGPDVGPAEPYFTGAILKLYEMMNRTIDPDGAYGEGPYLHTTMNALNHSLPALENVFKVDLSKSIPGVHRELIWAGIIKNNHPFQYGDSGGYGGINSSYWLLSKYRDPLLGWAYNYLKGGNLFEDVLWETEDVPRKDPFQENPVAVFHKTGITVFKSGWEKDDFVFVMKTGPFYNHQHIDQGSFFFADHGSTFIEERNANTYWYYLKDPLALSWALQPISHSTILINHQNKSQRIGDPLNNPEGFDDHAFIYHFLDGKAAAFSSGDIGRLYWNKVNSLRRNVLFIKPRTVLMLDTAIPGDMDADVTLLYQTGLQKELQAGAKVSKVTKDGNALFINHLYPENTVVSSVETPHYISTLKNDFPLEREAMLTLTARTHRAPLVIANLLTATKGEDPGIRTEAHDGYVSGSIGGKTFAFGTRLNSRYTIGEVTTDALAICDDGKSLFAALCTLVERNGAPLVRSSQPMTCDIASNRIHYCLADESIVSFAGKYGQKLILNGGEMKNAVFNPERKILTVTLPSGEGIVEIR